jgi:hypothetical protein
MLHNLYKTFLRKNYNKNVELSFSYYFFFLNFRRKDCNLDCLRVLVLIIELKLKKILDNLT